MRAQAKRSSANRDGSAVRGSVFGRILAATRASSLSTDGSGAPSAAHAVAPTGVHRFPVMLGALLAAALFALAFAASPAHAAKGWALKEVFGVSNQPSFTFINGTNLTLDDSGRLYVADASNRTVSRWNPDGTAANFATLGTNVIDGAGGADATPNGRVFDGSRSQVAVDNSGDPDTDGNVYIVGESRVDIFGADGTLLGQLTGCGATPFQTSSNTAVVGVAVSSAGDVYVTARTSAQLATNAVRKYVPVGGPPENGDCTPIFFELGAEHLAIGAGSSAGYIFARSATTTQKRNPGTGALQYSFGERAELSLDPVTGNLFAAPLGGNAVIEYNASGATSATELSKLQDAGGVVQGIAVTNSARTLYIARSGTAKVEVWEAVTAQEAETGPPALVSGAKATVTGTVKPFGTDVTDCYFEYGSTTAYGRRAPCDPSAASIPIDNGTHQVRGELTGMLANGATYHYRLVTNGVAFVPAADRTLRTADTYSTEPAEDVTGTTATLNGIVKPEGVALTDCYFEYGTDFLNSSVPCNPPAASIPNVDSDVAVSADLSGLEPSTTYSFRLIAVNSLGRITTAEQRFTTPGPPIIFSQAPLDATQTTATLQARINPAGSPTTYFFEWGPDTGYGTRVPADFSLFVGSGTEPVTVDIPLRGLQPQSVYHFRVIASNTRGRTVGPDQPFQTLGENGLPDNRATELVTPADKGPAGQVEQSFFMSQLSSLVSEDGNSIFYPIENAIPESTAGGWVNWVATRGEDGWANTQVSAPALIEPPEPGNLFAEPSRLLYTTPDLGCALLQSYQPLTEDTPPIGVDFGVRNLYRWSAEDGSYELVSDRLPLNPELQVVSNVFYDQIEASDDCDRIYFRSSYQLIRGASGLYVWDEGGTLRDAGRLPNGAVGAGVIVGGAYSEGPYAATSRWNAVTPNGTLFFSATSNAGADRRKRAIFMRTDDGSQVTVRDISLPGPGATAAPNGARFDAASPDGRKVFFVANHGLTSAASAGPTNARCDEVEDDITPPIEIDACDLYAYDTQTGALANLSATSDPDNPIGAAVQGPVAVDEDGSHVYFAALGQLVEGEGRTYAQNIAGEGSANIYLAADGELAYVTTLGSDELLGANTPSSTSILSAVLMRRQNAWTADVSADGSRLVFESPANLAGYDTGGGKAVYLYDAETEKLSCISCPSGGESLLPVTARMLVAPAGPNKSMMTPERNRSISADGSRIFFKSADVLAPGAEPGRMFGVGLIQKGNIYQWHEGQVTFLSTFEQSFGAGDGDYFGAGADGRTVFLATTESLLPQDTDFVSDVYAVRVDGGFSQPPEPDICDPLSGGSCEGKGSSAPGVADVATSALEGRGNQAVRWPKTKTACPRGKRKVTRGGKTRCVKKQAKKSKRTANKTRRASR